MARKTGKPSYRAARPVPEWRTRTAVVTAVVLSVIAALVGTTIGYAVGRPDATEAAIADQHKAEALRDVQQIADLTAMARRARDQITPILATLQPDTAAAGTQDLVSQWQQTMRQAEEQFADPPSGSTATNVARGGLRSAIQQAAVAVDTYAAALSAPEPQRQRLIALAVRQGTLAATTWSVAATQLDQINIDAGHGHQHVYLDLGGKDGAFTPDGAPEGSGK